MDLCLQVKGVRLANITVEYFTRWAEVEPLAKITKQRMTGFIWKFIICRFGILHSTVTDNGKQFDNARLTSFCEVLDIRKYFSMPNHPRANGQVKAVNKIIKHTLKAKHDALNGDGLRSSQRVMVLLHHKENQLERNHILPSLWCRGCNPARS